MSRWPTALFRLGLLFSPVPLLQLAEAPARAQGRAADQPAITLPAAPSTLSPAPADEPFSTDLDEMPDIGLEWPDLTAPGKPASATTTEAPVAPPVLAEPQPVAPAVPPAGAPEQGRASRETVRPPLLAPTTPANEDGSGIAAIDPGADLSYDVRLTGAEKIADTRFMERFNMLSELRKGAGSQANLAQISRRGKADIELVDELMRTRGYYDARVTFRMSVERPQPPLIAARIEVTPGTLYALSSVSLTGLSQTDVRENELRGLFSVASGDPADTDAIIAASDALKAGLADKGFPFAQVSEPELTVDHDDRNAALVMAVQSGGYRNFGRIIVEGDPPFDAAHIAEFARFKPGEVFNQADVTDLNSAIIATGLAGSVRITPREGATPDTADLVIAMTKAPKRTIAGQLGYGTGEGARAEVSWQHRNLFPPEGGLTLRTVVGTSEQSASAIFRRRNFTRRDYALNLEVAAANLNQVAYQARTFGISGSVERETNLIFQKRWVWSFGAELRLSDERKVYGNDPAPRRLLYTIAALPSNLTYDGSDDLLNPSRGFRLGARISPEVSFQSNVFTYVRMQVDGSGYVPVNDRLVLAGRVRLGTIVGAERDRIAPTRRFYAGGGASVRGYGYQAIGPRDIANEPVGGRSLTEAAIEARFRFGSMRQFGIVPFLDAGTISTDALPSTKDLRVGAGIGVRYYSNFGPIRIDVGTPINPQPGDSRIGVYVSLGQAF